MPNRLAIPQQSAKYKAFRILARLEKMLRGREAAKPEQLPSLRNFIFLQYDAPLGSAIHATPLFEALRRVLPDAHIIVAASSMAASILQHNPYIDRCVVTPNPEKNFLAAVSAARALYRSLPPGPGCIVTTTGNQRPILAMLALLAGDATRVGYTLALPLYDLALDFRAERPQIENNVEILRALGYEPAVPDPRIFFNQADAEYATHLLSGIAAESPRIAVVTQCSGIQPKQWSAARFQHVLAELSAARNATPIFFGTAEEAASIEVLRRPLTAPGISLVGKTTIQQLAAVLAQCDLILSVDTGTFHVARAVGLPGVVIAPAWQNPAEWLPVDHSNYRILCEFPMPMPTHTYRMDEISAEQALDAAMEYLDAFPYSTAARYARLNQSLSKTPLNPRNGV